MINIKGKNYETVAERVRKFREKYPINSGWQLCTEVSFRSDTMVFCRASIISPEGKTVAIGSAEERRNSSYINKTSAVENCETSAIGRALFTAGFGGGEFASADELHAAILRQGEIDRIGGRNDSAVSGSANVRVSPKDELLERFGIPKSTGLGIIRRNGMLVITGYTSNIYQHKGLIESAGFSFKPDTKKWIRKAS